jgi:riboflavin biosynthesis pyrimidine reductase
MAAMQLLWPEREPTAIDDTALTALYSPADRGVPAVRANVVTSLDGAASVDGYSAGLSGAADKRVFGRLRMLCDALLVGAGTFRTEGYRPLRLDPQRRAWRRANGLAEYPPIAIVSDRLALDPDHPALAGAPVRPIILTRGAAPAGPRSALLRVADVLVCGDTGVDLAVAVGELNRRGLRHILTEGGPQLFGALTAADLVDDLCLTVSPLLAGPGAGRITAGPAATAVRRMNLAHCIFDEGMLLLRYTRE